MSKEKFDAKCLDCRPVLIDPDTKEIMPKENPKMWMVNALWDGLSQETKLAWHNVTCQNSKDPKDLILTEKFVKDIAHAIE